MSEKHADEAQLAKLRPLRSQASDPGLTPDARLLGQALRQLHAQPEEGAPAVPPWAALEAEALRQSRRRQLRYHLRELWQGSLVLRLSLAAAATLAVVLLSAWGLRRAATSPGTLWARLAPARSGHSDSAVGRTGAARLQRSPQTSQPGQAVLLRCGAEVDLTFGVAEINERSAQDVNIQLARGRVGVKVPPMSPGGRLQVHTSDAEVTVHGTRFVVEKLAAQDATSVSVQEGLVEVRPLGGERPAQFLRPGEQLVVPSQAAYLRSLSEQVQGVLAAGRCDDQASQLLGTYLQAMPSDADLSAGEYLHASCAAAKGEVAAALQGFERVVQSAHSELRADNALARIAQLRATISRAEGTAAWRRYLLRFPQGQHRESAQHYLRSRTVRDEK